MTSKISFQDITAVCKSFQTFAENVKEKKNIKQPMVVIVISLAKSKTLAPTIHPLKQILFAPYSILFCS